MISCFCHLQLGGQLSALLTSENLFRSALSGEAATPDAMATTRSCPRCTLNGFCNIILNRSQLIPTDPIALHRSDLHHPNYLRYIQLIPADHINPIRIISNTFDITFTINLPLQRFPPFHPSFFHSSKNKRKQQLLCSIFQRLFYFFKFCFFT